MTFYLKEYQQRVLSRLDEYLRLARLQGAAAAYDKVARRENDKGEKENPYASTAYRQIVAGLDDCPHVCVRVPTGGGKTYLAARAVKHAANYMETPTPTVLWITPSDTICTQTADALKNRKHPCRAALDDHFGVGKVVVYDIDDFDTTRPQDFDSRACVIVTTAQMFRVKETKESRRIYAHHEHLQAHFDRFLPSQPPKSLKHDEKGGVVYSFANLLHLRRPLVVLDEAHKATSPLSYDVLRRVNPKCILEWTATPRKQSGMPMHNVLASATASELHAEEMLKMPVLLTPRDNWEKAVHGAINRRDMLAKIAKESGDAVRPIILYQAESKQKDKERITPEVLRKHLIENEGVDESAIAIHIGDKKEIDNVDLFAPDCAIEHIITVQALREGWDCSYAYVLCSVANMQSETAVEQLMGRVMRMPQARRRKHERLNCSYVEVPTDSAMGAVMLMREKIAGELGFEESEVKHFVQQTLSQEWHGGEDGGLLEKTDRTFEGSQAPSFDGLTAKAQKEAKDNVEVKPNTPEEGGCKIIVHKPVSEEVQKAIVAVMPEKRKERDGRRLRRVSERLSAPANSGVVFAPLPRLLFDSPEEGEVVADANSLHTAADWNGIGDDCLIGTFAITATDDTFEIKLDDGAVKIAKSEVDETLLFDTPVKENSEQKLVGWLERQIRNPDGRYVPETLQKYVKQNIADLTERRQYPMEHLLRAKYQLSEALKRRLAAYEEEVNKKTAKQFLFENGGLKCDFCEVFPARGYAPANLYKGAYVFKKHYYDRVGGFDSKPEEECAIALDINKDVACWVRNSPEAGCTYRIPYGVRYDFYPDFVAELTGGAMLVVEYKGAHLLPAAKDKLKAGALLEKTSGGKCFFLTVTDKDNKARAGDQIIAKIREIQERAKH